jgi:hypothetical protein
MQTLLGQDGVWLAVGVIALWTALMSLKVISARIENANAWRELRIEARRLRARFLEQTERTRSAGRWGGASPAADAAEDEIIEV